MGVLRHNHGITVVTAFVLLFLASASANIFTTTRQLVVGSGLVGVREEETRSSSSSSGSEEALDMEGVLTRRRLGGPGSSPPTCRSKCGRCSPCKAVHVPIQPGRSIPLEYYPEAWRCKCGNKLFMP